MCNFVDLFAYKLKSVQIEINSNTNNLLRIPIKNLKMGCANCSGVQTASITVSKADLGMHPFRAWLAKTSKSVKAGRFGSGPNCTSPLRIVMGNTSCDVDSAVGALCLAYYYQLKFNQQWVPVINCRREDFYCNLEIVKHLANCHISQKDLYFYDEFRAQFPDPEAISEVALIDHNELDVEQSDLGRKVTRVIDHHHDSGAYADQIVEKQCRLIGSACSLVALMMKQDEAVFAEDLKRPKPNSPNLAYLLAAAVVLDSYFFKEELRSKKWTEEDEEAHQWLMQYANVDRSYWEQLNNAKFDVTAGLELGLEGIFIRDYKCYDLPSGFMGVSVSTGSIDTMIKHFGEAKFGSACRDYVLKRKLGMFVIVAIQASDDGKIEKNIMIFDYHDNPVNCVLKDKKDSLCALIEGTEDMMLSDKKVLGPE